MKRSLLVLAASSVFMLGACASEEEATEEMPVEEVTPAPAPAPAPMDTMPMDTMPVDTMATTTTGQ